MAYQSVTLTQLTTLAKARFDNPTFWSDYEYQTAFNEALSLFQLATGRWRARYTLTTVAKRVWYSIPDLAQLQVAGICQVLALFRVSYNGSAPLGWSSWNDMDLTAPGWQIQTTATAGCPDAPALCGPAGFNLFFIWPADAAGGNSLTLDVITNAPKLSAGGDYINLDTTEITGILGYAEHRLSSKRGGLFFARTLDQLRDFYRMLAQRNSYLLNIGIYKGAVGSQWARAMMPRRVADRSGAAVGLGIR